MSTRFNAMLAGLLEPSFDDRTPFGDQLAAWLVQIADYEQDSGERFHNRMKIAVLTARAPPSASTEVRRAAAICGDDWNVLLRQLKDWLQLDIFLRPRWTCQLWS